MNHVKIIIIRAGPPEMPLGIWYNCGTKHFHLTSIACEGMENLLD